jgi:hypothetical protein
LRDRNRATAFDIEANERRPVGVVNARRGARIVAMRVDGAAGSRRPAAQQRLDIVEARSQSTAARFDSPSGKQASS